MVDDVENRKVGWIAVLIVGFLADGTLRSLTIISKADLSDLKSYGCAKLGNIVFSENWSHEQCTNFLKDILPQPFTYARESSEHGKATRSAKAAAAKPTWALVTQDRRKLKLVSEDRPTGKDLWFYWCRRKEGPDDVHIIIVLRRKVPAAVLESWKPVQDFDLPSSDIHMYDAENSMDEESSIKAASEYEPDCDNISNSGPQPDSEVTRYYQTRKRTRDSSDRADKYTPEVESPPLKKQKLDYAGNSRITSSSYLKMAQNNKLMLILVQSSVLTP